MKKLIGLTIVSLFILSSFAIANEDNDAARNEKFIIAPCSSENNINRGVEVLYSEEFESGLNGWTHVDGSIPTQNWHLSDFWTPEGTGLSWWSGDEELEGYIDMMYLVLDTPEIDLSTASDLNLTFDLNYCVEEPAGLAGWDGCNVRISTDSGVNWQVIEGSPAYNTTSMSCFELRGEGPNVHGWGGSSEGWIAASFDLSAYADDTVMIRFAFASDAAFCTWDYGGHDLFGMIVDNIVLGDFSNTGELYDMVASSLVPVGGDIWHIDVVDDAPSPTHAFMCQNAAGSYDINLSDYIESPTIHLPEEAVAEIWADFMIKGNFIDPDATGDHWMWLVSPDDGIHYYNMTNPYGTGTSYIMGTPADTWNSAIGSYSSFNGGHIDNFAGLDVRFRIYFETDDDTPDGIGIMIDNFEVYVNYYVGPVANNLLAENVDSSVELEWGKPDSTLIDYIVYNDGWFDNFAQVDYPMATKIENPFDYELPITEASFVMARWNDPTEWDTQGIIFEPAGSPIVGTVDLAILDDNGGVPGVILYETTGLEPTVRNYEIVDVSDEDIIIPVGGSIWIQLSNYSNDGGLQGFWCSYTHPSWGDPHHSYVFDGSTWNPVTDYSALRVNYLTGSSEYVCWAPDVAATVIVRDPHADLLEGYNVYHSLTNGGDYTFIGTVGDPNITTFTDEESVVGDINYYVVTALYDEFDSDYSNQALAYVVTATETCYKYDDGSAESEYNAGAGKNLAVRITPNIDPGIGYVKLIKVEFFLTSVTQNIIVNVWDDDGPDGEPGTQLLDPFLIVPVGQLIENSWNIITLLDIYNIQISDGDFYVGWFEPSGASSIGVDQGPSFNRSYQYTGTEWQDYNDGVPQNIMMRAVVDRFVSTGPDVSSQVSYLKQSVPNPVTNNATISYNIKGSPMNNAQIKIYNVLGQLVDTIQGENGEATWNPGTAPNGIY
ncbi:hypothetical protein D4R71_06165, partial [bacterium]